MKLNYKTIPAFLENPAQHRAVLIYGVDDGLVREYHQKILQKLCTNADDPFSKTMLDADQVASDPSCLYEAMASMNLMGEAPPVVVRDATDKLSKTMASALEQPECQNFLLVLARDLPAKSSLRKVFESAKQKDIATLACYKDEGFSLEKTLKAKLSEAGIRYSPAVIHYLKDSLGNDRGVTSSEVEKILLYLGDETTLDVETAALLVGENDDKGSDDLCQSVLDGNSARSNLLTERLFSEGSNPIMLIRSLMRYVSRLEMAKSYQDQGVPQEEAMKKLSPPVFFKQAPSFKNHMNRLSSGKLQKMLSLLLKAETDCKRSPNSEILCQRAFTSLSHLCRR